MAFSMGGGGVSRPQINVTPLIDVLLTLIVMFMLVVSLEGDRGEETQIPQPDNQASTPRSEGTIVIQVVWLGKDQQPQVKINHEDVPWQNLEARISEIYLKRAQKVAFVRSDADIDFQYVADVIDLAHHGGVQRIGLLTQDRMLEGE